MEAKASSSTKRALLVLNCILLSIGNCGGPLVMRSYFIHGGNRMWLSSFLETAGFPIILIILVFAYFKRRAAAGIGSAGSSVDDASVRTGSISACGKAKTPIFYMNRRVFLASAVIGVLTGLDDYFYAYGVAKLPVSTSSLIIASQLAFTAFFAFLLVKQKFTSFAINAVFLLTVGAGVLALHSRGDRPKGESSREYAMGFVMTLAAAALYGFILPLVELTYNKAKQAVTYTLVLEIQMVMCLFATIFCAVGMVVNNDFQVIARESREFELGKAKYYIVLVFSGIIWQCFFLGVIGVIFCASSLLCGIVIAVLLPVTEVLAVIFYKEKFQAEKGVSLVLSMWGFLSYFYGEFKQSKKQLKKPVMELPLASGNSTGSIA